MIKLKDFVDVNLTSLRPTSNEANKTVVYIYSDKTADANSWSLNASNYKAVLTALDTKAQDFVKQFFALEGASLKVIRLKTTSATSYDIVNQNNEAYLEAVKGLKMQEVALVLREASTGEVTTGEYYSDGYHYESFTTSAGDVDGFEVLLASIKEEVTDKGTAYRKLITRGFYVAEGSYYTKDQFIDSNDNWILTQNENLIWKLAQDEKDLASVLAYLSKVSIDNPDTLRDYSFTEEPTCTDMKSALNGADGTENAITWSDIKDYINVDIDLQEDGTIVNLGGNTSDGFDIIQEFESIYISQRLVNKELALLRSKINLSEAKSVIHSAIIDVMETYYNIGYLIQTQYTGQNIYRNINGTNICILAKGEVITAGYKVIILPKKIGSDIHEFPEIELVISTNKGIRYIKTTGVVL